MSDDFRHLLMVVLVLALGACFVGAVRAEAGKPRRPQPSPEARSELEELIERDPFAALAKYGTPEDAERLNAMGVDLEGSGYRRRDES